jgi:5-methylcytosine-specific restriction endonuclease McrBC regulatory subunit McrC
VRCRIDMKRVALARPGRDFELVIRHAPLSPDNDAVRAVRWTVREVASRTRRSETRRAAQALLGELGGVADIEADAALFDRISLTPLEEYWGPLLAFGRSLARQRSLDPASAGGQPSVAVLFTLHDLFERALRRVLYDHGPAAGLLPASIPRHLLRSDAGADLVRLKPDYVLRFAGPSGNLLAVADAKWKDIWTGAGTPEPGREDAYQLTAYMAAGGASSGFLFAPLVGGGPQRAAPLSPAPHDRHWCDSRRGWRPCPNPPQARGGGRAGPERTLRRGRRRYPDGDGLRRGVVSLSGCLAKSRRRLLPQSQRRRDARRDAVAQKRGNGVPDHLQGVR